MYVQYSSHTTQFCSCISLRSEGKNYTLRLEIITITFRHSWMETIFSYFQIWGSTGQSSRPQHRRNFLQGGGMKLLFGVGYHTHFKCMAAAFPLNIHWTYTGRSFTFLVHSVYVSLVAVFWCTVCVVHICCLDCRPRHLTSRRSTTKWMVWRKIYLSAKKSISR